MNAIQQPPAAQRLPAKRTSLCHRCNRPATAGPVPDSITRNHCIECAAIASVTLQPTPERRAPAPEALQRSPAWAIAQQYTPDNTLWNHQSNAIQLLLQGHNTLIATSTASGKTLVFQSYVMHLLSQDPEATAIVLYPTKALANDQNLRWKQACQLIGYSQDTVGQIDGTVDTRYRDNILKASRVVIMTPDVCHAWLIRRSQNQTVHRFLAGLRAIVIDEAHTYESVFGSNSAYLFRRLTSAAADCGPGAPPLYVAATATIESPQEHLRKLTGQQFQLVAEDQNGTPKHPRQLLHLPTEDSIDAKQLAVAKLIVSVLDADPEAQVIAFCDSRQGVERIVQIVDRKQSVLPYRSGYRPEERRDIEEKLKQNQIRAVVATSALELGIDMPDLSYGIQMELPPSRKQFHQRLGRIGRSKPGSFVLLAPPHRFFSMGDTLEGYYAKHVEPSHLYLTNEFISYAQALCLRDELTARKKPANSLPAQCEWPPNFARSLNDANRPPPEHLAPIANASFSKPPHHAYSLRTTGEDTLAILEVQHPGSQRENTTDIGEISVSQAMREAYPGAIYRHRGNPYQIKSWKRRRNTFDPFITAQRIGETHNRTRPIMRQILHVDPDPSQIVGDRYEDSHLGCISELMITVTESVEGYRLVSNQRANRADQSVFYRDTSPRDPDQSRKQRVYSTTAFLIRINQPWFKGANPDAAITREELAQALRRHLSYRRSIALQDLSATSQNIVIASPTGSWLADDAIVVHDNTFGGLGLIEHLYTNLEDYAQALTASQPSPDHDAILISPETVQNFNHWLQALPDSPPGAMPAPTAHDWYKVMAPGSKTLALSEDDPPLPAQVLGHSWEDQILYNLKTIEGELVTAEESFLSTRAPNMEWRLWKPSTATYQDFTTH